jgi:hypothetical protein
MPRLYPIVQLKLIGKKKKEEGRDLENKIEK